MFKRFKSKDAWKKQKYPARVGYYKIGDGDWYEVWNNGDNELYFMMIYGN